MLVTAWSNGKGSYGLKLSECDQNSYFKRDWQSVILDLEGVSNPITVNTDKSSFWKNCRELISKDIKEWFSQQGVIPWLPRYPPKFQMELVNHNRFKVLKKIE